MLLAIVFANVWGVLQLIALGSFARTAHARAVVAALLVGFFACVPLALALEHAWMMPVAWLTGTSLSAVIEIAGYTVDPLIEQLIQALPLLLLALVPVIRRQWGVTDFVLTGAAIGAGFGLAEDLFRFGSLPQEAMGIPGGWIVSATRFYVPDVSTSASTWLPDIGTVRLLPPSISPLPNVLLIWGALVGLSVGLVLHGRRSLRWAAVTLFLYTAGEHAAFNADITLGAQALTAPFRALRDFAPFMPVAALGLAWWVDRGRQRCQSSEHLLAAERSASWRIAGTWQAALARPPYSLKWVDSFVRLRRACNSESREGNENAERLNVALTRLREHIDDELASSSRLPPVLPSKAEILANLGRTETRVWLIVMLPAALWFVFGGWPATAWLQRFLSVGVGWTFTVILSLAAQGWLIWRALTVLGSWRAVVQLPVADPAATFVLRTAAAVGAIGFGAFGVLRALSLWSAAPTLLTGHVTDAAGSLAPAQAAPTAGAGPITLPPGWEKQYSFSPTQEKYAPIKYEDAWDKGFKRGKDGGPGMSPADPRPAWRKDYERGYEAGKSQAKPRPEHPAIRKPLPGEEIETRDIPVMDDEYGYHMKTIKGPPAELDMIEAYQQARMWDAVVGGLFGGLAGMAPTPIKPFPRESAGGAPMGTRDTHTGRPPDP